MAHGYNLEAQYQDGFVHLEDEQDKSLYKADGNVFHDIVNKLPEDDHGKMVRFSIVGKDTRYDIDWTKLPSNARPIYFRQMAQHHNLGTNETMVECLSHNFGYQYNDSDGNNHKEVQEIN